MKKRLWFMAYCGVHLILCFVQVYRYTVVTKKKIVIKEGGKKLALLAAQHANLQKELDVITNLGYVKTIAQTQLDLAPLTFCQFKEA